MLYRLITAADGSRRVFGCPEDRLGDFQHLIHVDGAVVVNCTNEAHTAGAALEYMSHPDLLDTSFWIEQGGELEGLALYAVLCQIMKPQFEAWDMPEGDNPEAELDDWLGTYIPELAFEGEEARIAFMIAGAILAGEYPEPVEEAA